MKAVRTIKTWTCGILVAAIVGVHPWLASVNAEVSAEKQTQINRLAALDEADPEALQEALCGLSAKDLGTAFRETIMATAKDKIKATVQRYANAAITVAYDEECGKLDPLMLAQQLGLNMAPGAQGVEGITQDEMETLLSDISAASTKGALEAARTKDRVGVIKKLAYGAIRDVDDPDVAKALTRGITAGALFAAADDEIETFGMAVAQGALSGSANQGVVSAVTEGVGEGVAESNVSPEVSAAIQGATNNMAQVAASAGFGGGDDDDDDAVDAVPASPDN